jgi:hypothetical protein
MHFFLNTILDLIGDFVAGNFLKGGGFLFPEITDLAHFRNVFK